MHDRGIADRREDDEIVADFVAGTSRGLERAYQRHGGFLYSVARHVLGDDADAQDCVHDTLLRVWQRREAFQPERGSLRSYLLVAVRNEALTRKRNAARHVAIEMRLARSEPGVYEFDVSDPVDKVRLGRALAALPPEQKVALELVYFGQLTHVQVAERLDVPLGTIKSRIAMALRKLGAALAENTAGSA